MYFIFFSHSVLGRIYLSVSPNKHYSSKWSISVNPDRCWTNAVTTHDYSSLFATIRPYSHYSYYSYYSLFAIRYSLFAIRVFQTPKEWRATMITITRSHFMAQHANEKSTTKPHADTIELRGMSGNIYFCYQITVLINKLRKDVIWH